MVAGCSADPEGEQKTAHGEPSASEPRAGGATPSAMVADCSVEPEEETADGEPSAPVAGGAPLRRRLYSTDKAEKTRAARRALEPSPSSPAPGSANPRQESSSSTSTALPKRRRTDADDVGEPLATILRMSGLGMRTAVISQALAIDEDQVVAALMKQTGGNTEESTATEPVGEAAVAISDEKSKSTLVSRLLTDPVGLCCPISSALMVDPVVAEDGNTYERHAIAAALARKAESPITKHNMGRQLLPTQAIRSQITDYIEKTVVEILSVVPCVDKEDASKLLARAEGFLRPRLPDSQARRRLTEVLVMHSRLPGLMASEALAELVELLVESPDEEGLVELLSRRDDFGLGAQLSSFDARTITKMHGISRAHCPTAPINVALDKEYAVRLAGWAAGNCANEADPTRVAKVLYQIGCKEDRARTSMEKLAECKEAGSARSHLVSLLSGAVGREDVDEGLILRLLTDMDHKIPEDAIRRLRLDPKEMDSMQPGVLMSLARRLSRAERLSDAARIAILAAKKHQDDGRDDEAQAAYFLAYDLDSTNMEATRGLMGLCAVATQNCNRLQAECRELRGQVLQQGLEIQGLEQLVQSLLAKEASKGSLLTWDVSAVAAASMSRGQKIESPTFRLLSSCAEGTLLFYPKGFGQQTCPQVYLKVTHRAELDFTISCDLVSMRGTKSFEANTRKGFDFPEKDKYNTVTLTLHHVKLRMRNDTVVEFKGSGASLAGFG